MYSCNCYTTHCRRLGSQNVLQNLITLDLFLGGPEDDSKESKYVALKLYEGRTESHEQLFLHATREQQTKESTVVDGTSSCVILECLVTSIACIT